MKPFVDLVIKLNTIKKSKLFLVLRLGVGTTLQGHCGGCSYLDVNNTINSPNYFLILRDKGKLEFGNLLKDGGCSYKLYF